MTHDDLARKLARSIFEAPAHIGSDRVSRIQFKGGAHGSFHETDLGGFCEEALVEHIKTTLSDLLVSATRLQNAVHRERVAELEALVQQMMARLADLLDADQFGNIEAMVLAAGVPYPPQKYSGE